MFNERKAAQLAAYLISREHEPMSLLRLMKLMYLVDRASLDEFGHPVTYDKMASMEHGPVLSAVYDLAKDEATPTTCVWRHWITIRNGNRLSANQRVTREALEDLSDADLAIADEVWARLGHLTPSQLRRYTHDHCPEWADPGKSSKPILYSDVFRALGRSAEVADYLSERLEGFDDISRRLARA